VCPRSFFLIIIKTRREQKPILACQNADERADGVALHYYQQNGQGISMRRYTLSNDVIELHGGHVYQLAPKPKFGVLFGPFQMQVGHKLALAWDRAPHNFLDSCAYTGTNTASGGGTRRLKKVSREIGQLEMNPGLR
jgi:hypothetical protein